MTNLNNAQRETYWQGYYDSNYELGIPSQFAVFVAQELPMGTQIIDVGTGTGRDALFFASTGRNVLAIDESTVALEKLDLEIAKHNLSVSTLCKSISTPDFIDEVSRRVETEFAIYARFFLHAISEEEERVFFQHVKSLFGFGGNLCFLEFRTIQDAELPKTTPPHYRRFVDFERLKDMLIKEFRFRILYEISGRGFAKFKGDDAHVARLVLSSGDADGSS